MSDIAPPVAALIEEFSKLPGVGVKTAQRLTFFILRSPTDQARRLAEAIMRVKESIVYCSRCFNITETDPCTICSNPNRDNRKSTRLNSSHSQISYAVFCLKKKKIEINMISFYYSLY